MAALASDWHRHFRLLLWNRWTELNKTWQEARSQCPLPSLCFSGRLVNQDGHPGLWLAETFSHSSLTPLNGIQWNLTGSKISTKFEFLGAVRLTKMSGLVSDGLRHFHNETWKETRSLRPLPSFFGGRWPLIGIDIFKLFLETSERNSTKLVRKQDLNVFYQVCAFLADRNGSHGSWLAKKSYLKRRYLFYSGERQWRGLLSCQEIKLLTWYQGLYITQMWLVN